MITPLEHYHKGKAYWGYLFPNSDTPTSFGWKFAFQTFEGFLIILDDAHVKMNVLPPEDWPEFFLKVFEHPYSPVNEETY